MRPTPRRICVLQGEIRRYRPHGGGTGILNVAPDVSLSYCEKRLELQARGRVNGQVLRRADQDQGIQIAIGPGAGDDTSRGREIPQPQAGRYQAGHADADSFVSIRIRHVGPIPDGEELPAGINEGDFARNADQQPDVVEAVAALYPNLASRTGELPITAPRCSA